jgi:hypothetical protein
LLLLPSPSVKASTESISIKALLMVTCCCCCYKDMEDDLKTIYFDAKY